MRVPPVEVGHGDAVPLGDELAIVAARDEVVPVTAGDCTRLNWRGRARVHGWSGRRSGCCQTAHAGYRRPRKGRSDKGLRIGAGQFVLQVGKRKFLKLTIQ